MNEAHATPVLLCEGISLRSAPKQKGGIGFSLHAGETYAIIGPHGSGKTQLLRTVLGLDSPATGHTLILGRSPQENAITVRRRFGYSPQKNGIPEWMDARAAGALVGELQPAWDEDIFEQVLEEFEVPEKVPTNLLTETQKNGLSLSLALGHRPHLLVADDAFGFLSTEDRFKKLEPLVAAAKEAGMAVLLTSSDPTRLGSLLDQVGVLPNPEGDASSAGSFETHRVADLCRRYRRVILNYPAGLPTEFRLNGALGIELERDRISVVLQGNDQEAQAAVAHLGAGSVHLEPLTASAAVEEGVKASLRGGASR